MGFSSRALRRGFINSPRKEKSLRPLLRSLPRREVGCNLRARLSSRPRPSPSGRCLRPAPADPGQTCRSSTRSAISLCAARRLQSSPIIPNGGEKINACPPPPPAASNLRGCWRSVTRRRSPPPLPAAWGTCGEGSPLEALQRGLGHAQRAGRSGGQTRALWSSAAPRGNNSVKPWTLLLRRGLLWSKWIDASLLCTRWLFERAFIVPSLPKRMPGKRG